MTPFEDVRRYQKQKQQELFFSPNEKINEAKADRGANIPPGFEISISNKYIYNNK